MDKEYIYNEMLERIERIINTENQRTLELSDYNPKTRILNRSYANGKIHAYLDIIEDLCGMEYQIKAHDVAKEFIETSFKICDGIYSYLPR